MAHKNLVGGTAYDTKGGRCLDEGTGYDIKKGRTFVGGTGYDISFENGTPISALEVGSSVYLGFNYTQKEFLVVNHGIPSSSSLYDSSCDGTWLLMKDVYTQRVWSSVNTGYANSDVHAYLNGDFLGLFDSGIQSAIKQIKLPYHDGNGQSGSVVSGSSGLSTKIFLLGGYEVGFSGSTYPVDGTCLSYFSGASNSKRIGYYYSGTATTWWLRSMYLSQFMSNMACHITTSGTGGGTGIGSTSGIRPALVLPSETPITFVNDSYFTVVA